MVIFCGLPTAFYTAQLQNDTLLVQGILQTSFQLSFTVFSIGDNTSLLLYMKPIHASGSWKRPDCFSDISVV